MRNGSWRAWSAWSCWRRRAADRPPHHGRPPRHRRSPQRRHRTTVGRLRRAAHKPSAPATAASRTRPSSWNTTGRRGRAVITGRRDAAKLTGMSQRQEAGFPLGLYLGFVSRETGGRPSPRSLTSGMSAMALPPNAMTGCRRAQEMPALACSRMLAMNSSTSSALVLNAVIHLTTCWPGSQTWKCHSRCSELISSGGRIANTAFA